MPSDNQASSARSGASEGEMDATPRTVRPRRARSNVMTENMFSELKDMLISNQRDIFALRSDNQTLKDQLVQRDNEMKKRDEELKKLRDEVKERDDKMLLHRPKFQSVFRG